MIAPSTPLTLTSMEDIEADVPLDTLRLMTRTCLMAVVSKMPEEAQIIVDFSSYIAVAMARVTVAIATGRRAEALEKLDRLSNASPEIDAVTCAYAMLKKEMGVSGWRPLAQRVIERNTDPQAVEVARDLLDTASRRSGKSLGASAAQVGLRFV
jgi:Bacterial type III secretion protein (HrpB1_HrpK)